MSKIYEETKESEQSLWGWTNYKVIALKEDEFHEEHILNMLADLYERVKKIEQALKGD